MEDTKILNEILETVNFLKDNMVSKDELDSGLNTVRKEMQEEFAKVREEIISHVDGFIGLHQKLDIELTSLRSKVDRMEAFIQRIAVHVALPVEN